MKAFEALRFGSQLLKDNKVKSFILDSELLLSKCLNKSRENILTNLEQNINHKEILVFQEYIARRSKNEPVAYILGEKEFWSHKFYITKDTLIPRPETELLVDILSKYYNQKKITILDIGTGSGCLILSLLSELKKSSGIAVDISSKAIKVAKQNASNLKLLNRIKFLNRSFDDIINKKFDLIVSNPPYIARKDIKNLSCEIKKYEPKIALDGGKDGLDLIKKVIYKSKSILKTNGSLAIEIGNEQIKTVQKILINNRFKIKNILSDYKDNIRGIIAVSMN